MVSWRFEGFDFGQLSRTKVVMMSTIKCSHSSMRVFCNHDAFVSLWHPDGHCGADNAPVAVRDISATSNPLKLLAATDLLSPISNHRATTRKLRIRSGPMTSKDHWP